MVVGLLPAASTAQTTDPAQVQGLTVDQRHGFATLRWTPVEGATDYQIERTPVDDDDSPIGSSVIVGVWRPTRTVTPASPTFADSGFVLGERLRWRVRARFGTAPQPYSEPVSGSTLPQWGDEDVAGENLRTQWESTLAAQFTSDVDEYAYTEAVAELSDRVRVVEIGRTVLDRPINMFIIGYPQPPETAQEVAAGPSAMVNCNVHGNEPSSREACLIMARELAFADDARTIDILSNMTVLIVPTINGDGRAANTRGNATGQDLNRDHSLLRQPETFAFAEALRDYQPQTAFDGHEFGNSNAGDLPILPARHLNVAQSVFDEGMRKIEGWMYEAGSAEGWWFCPYGCQGGGNVGLSQETILRNTLGLKNVIGTLLEARSSGGATRPGQGGGNTPAYRRLKAYSALWTYHEYLDYQRARQAAIDQAVDEALEFQTANIGRVVFRGSRPIPAHPAPHPGQAPPPDEPPSGVLEAPPCGYRLNALQYSGSQPDGPTVAERLAAHGIDVAQGSSIIGTDFIVPMAQPLRGLIPLLLDGQAAEPMVNGQRIDCAPVAQVSPDSLSATATEGTQTTADLNITNDASDVEQSLSWTIETAESDCSSPSELDWVGADPAFGSTAPSSSSTVEVTFDASALVAPETRTGLLCVSTNDPDRPLISVPVELQAQYPMTGFVGPVRNPPQVNAVRAGSTGPMKFSLGGDRGLDVLAADSPASQAIDCTSFAPLGPVEPTVAAGNSPLQYDASTDTYTYPWKTDSAWPGTCRQFILSLDDASEHLAYFRFR